MLETLWLDIRFAIRTLRKNAAFSFIAVATLALGIGANTAIFSLVDHVILRPLSYRDSGRLYVIQEHLGGIAAKVPPLLPVNAMHFEDWRTNLRSFEQMALVSGISLNITGTGTPERLFGGRVSYNLFQMLGVNALLGRTFSKEEDTPGRDHVIVLNYDLWKSRFGGDPGILGRKVLLDGEPYEVIGVLPQEFRFPKLGELYTMDVPEERARFWKPFAIRKDELSELGDFDFACIARLKPSVSLAQAQQELNVLQAGIAKRAPIHITLSAVMAPLSDQITQRVRSGLVLVFGAVTLLLVLTCVNLASLLLARGTGRRTEMAIRSAMGASGTRLLRQMLAESLTLALAGGVLGIVVAYAAARLVVAVAPVDVPRIEEVHIDGQVLLFTLAISVVSGLLFGLMPAWSASKGDPQQAIRAGGRGLTEGRAPWRSRSFLIGAEVCLSAVCLAGAGLLVHSFVNLLSVDKGFQISRLITADVQFPFKTYPNNEKRAAALKAILDSMKQLPDAEGVAAVNRIPLSGEGNNNIFTAADQLVSLGERPLADIRSANPDYFRTIGIPLQAGRIFAEADRSHPVALLSGLAAAKLWPGQNPVGREIVLGDDDKHPIQVVGVVRDVRGASLDRQPTMTIYLPYWQKPSGEMTLLLKTPVSASAASRELRSAVRQIDAQLPVEHFQSMEERLDESVAQRRFQTELISLFAICALLLASLGIYGMVAYAVTQRTSEIGIRMALGAGRSGIATMIVSQGFRPITVGLVAGLIGSIALSRELQALLFGVKAVDPLTLAAVVAVLAGVSVAAMLLPAVRAMRVNPVEALRYQ